MTTDEQSALASHIRLLSTLHYVMALITGLTALIPCIHVAIGVMLVSGNLPSGSGSGGAPPDAFGWLFIIGGLAFILIGLALAVVIFIAGRRLAERRSHTFCLVVAGLECLNMPLGTILGVFTIVILSKPEAKAMFKG